MPHNRSDREKEVTDKYEIVVFMGEYSLSHALLAAIDAFSTGGTYTAEYLQRELVKFGIDVITALSRAGVNPATEPIYLGRFIFKNWETPLPSVTFPLPNKFVPYLAVRKRSSPSSSSTSIGGILVEESDFKDADVEVFTDGSSYIHVDWSTRHLIITGVPGSAASSVANHVAHGRGFRLKWKNRVARAGHDVAQFESAILL